MRKILVDTALLSLLLSIFVVPRGFTEDIYTGFFSNKAVSGYDTVAFFTRGKPVKGSSDHKVEYLGAVWHFSSAKNKELFESDPDKYRPQYGGYCAWAVAENKAKAPGNVKYWKIVDEKLYLNYNDDVQKKWLLDIPGFIARADVIWPEISQEH